MIFSNRAPQSWHWYSKIGISFSLLQYNESQPTIQRGCGEGCGEFIFGLDRRGVFQLIVNVEGQKSPGPKITEGRKSHLTGSSLLLTVSPSHHGTEPRNLSLEERSSKWRRC